MSHLDAPPEIKRIRLVLAIFMVGLVLSGVTAFPLQREVDLLARLVGSAPAGDAELGHWIQRVREGLTVTYAAYPFMAYGTDWLAFGHLVIALFFIAPWHDPVRYEANIKMGLVACVLVLPLAFVCGPVRGIPFYWQVVDASFGIFGALPLLYALRLTHRLAARPAEF